MLASYMLIAFHYIDILHTDLRRVSLHDPLKLSGHLVDSLLMANNNKIIGHNACVKNVLYMKINASVRKKTKKNQKWLSHKMKEKQIPIPSLHAVSALHDMCAHVTCEWWSSRYNFYDIFILWIIINFMCLLSKLTRCRWLVGCQVTKWFNMWTFLLVSLSWESPRAKLIRWISLLSNDNDDVCLL